MKICSVSLHKFDCAEPYARYNVQLDKSEGTYLPGEAKERKTPVTCDP